MKKEIRKSLDKIKVSSNLENKIMTKTILASKRQSRFKLSYTIGMFIILFAILIISVNADSIEKFIAKIISQGAVITEDGEKHQMYTEVNGIKLQNLDKYEKDKNLDSTIEKIEEDFRITLLKYDFATSSEASFELLTDMEINSERKGMVDRLYIIQINFYNGKYGYSESMGGNYGFSLDIRIIADNASENTIMAHLEEMNTTTGKQTILEYHSENLDTNVLIYKYEHEAPNLEAVFVYKNIRYEISGSFKKELPLDDLKNIIEEMHE